jgi:8-oxo-dGTP pyrophosphatase MutT (NUDIX family)
MTETPVVTCFLRHAGDVLLLRRSADVGSYRGRWGAVSGHVEGDPDEDALREIGEETGLRDAVTLVRRGAPFAVADEDLDRRWIVHPYLFDAARCDLRLDWESTEAAWVPPTEILRRPVVPWLWTSYMRVAPSVEDIEQDHTHGSAHLSVLALEVLRHRAGLLAHRGAEGEPAPEQLRSLARRLLGARPAMTVLANRVNRVLYACREESPGAFPACVEEEAHRVIGEALAADAAAAGHAAALVKGRRVLTLSRSGTVSRALLEGRPAAVFVAVSRPGGEGGAVAR